MQVVIIGSSGFDTIEFHFADSFRFLGHEVNIIDILDFSPFPYSINYFAIKHFRSFDEGIFNKISQKVISLNPDLVICTYRFINPNSIKFIKRELPNIPVVHLNPDALITFEYQQIFASPYDFYFTKDPYIVDFMVNKNGLNAFYLAEAFNPRFHSKPTTNRHELEEQLGIDLLSFGYVYPYRANMLSKIVESGINISIFGKKDKRYFRKELDPYFKNEWITGTRKSELLYGAKVILNNFHYSEINSVNCKFFEIAGIGGFQICDYKESITKYSSIDVNSFTYNSLDEAIDLIKFYLDKPELRYNLSDVQYEYFLRNHTYEHRSKEMLQIIFK